MPAFQGCLDGLCGPYAIANAFELCGLERHHRTFFEVACATAPKHRWPVLLWKGTTFGDLKRMVRHCVSSTANRSGISVRFPFDREVPPTNAAYWERFDNAFSDPRVVCGIVGLHAPTAHWIVVVPEGGRITFVDSCPQRPVFRKNRASLYAGYRRTKSNQWLFDRRALTLFLKP